MEYRIISSSEGIKIPKIISIDTEYSDKNIRKAELLSISVGVSDSLTYILEDFHAIERFLSESDIYLTWNGLVDWFMLNKYSYNMPKHKIVDAMLMEHIVDERLDHGLGDFALREYGDNYKKIFWDKYKSYQEAPKDIAYEYEMRDGCYTYAAGVKYLAILKDKLELVKSCHKLNESLFDTTIRGVRVDKLLIKTTEQDTAKQIQEYLPKLRSQFNEYCELWEIEEWTKKLKECKTEKGRQGVKRPAFKFDSPKQLSWLLYTALGILVNKRTKKGSPSTDADALQDASEQHVELTILRDYKDCKALYATFIKGMMDRVEEDRIHPGFFVNGTATGRISHNNPNMGNLPREGVIRNFFLPQDGYSILGCDFSQLEVVIEANLTEDKQLLKIINEGASKHDITANGLGISRDSAKTLNFALQYGAGVKKICKILGVSQETGQDIFKRYWELYSGVRDLKERTCKTLEETGQVENLFGRVRHFDKPKNEFEKSRYERQAYNHVIQGTGADMTNRSSWRIADELRNLRLGWFWFSVHDEVVTECSDGNIGHCKELITKCMNEPSIYLNLKYPVKSKIYGPLKCWSKG